MGGDLNTCPDGLGHLFREELSMFKGAFSYFGGVWTLARVVWGTYVVKIEFQMAFAQIGLDTKCPRVPVWVRGRGGAIAIWAMPMQHFRWGFPNVDDDDDDYDDDNEQGGDVDYDGFDQKQPQCNGRWAIICGSGRTKTHVYHTFWSITIMRMMMMMMMTIIKQEIVSLFCCHVPIDAFFHSFMFSHNLVFHISRFKISYLIFSI